MRSVAGADFAFVRDSAALAFVSQLEFASGDAAFLYRLERERVWVPGEKPLRPGVVFREAMVDIEQFGAEALCCDDHYLASVIEVTETHDVPHVRFPSDAEGISRAFVRVRVLLGARAIDLTEASDQLIAELKETMSKPLSSGLVSITHPRRGSSHGDRARAFVAGVYALETADSRALESEDGLTSGARRMARRGRASEQGADGRLRVLPPKMPG